MAKQTRASTGLVVAAAVLALAACGGGGGGGGQASGARICDYLPEACKDGKPLLSDLPPLSVTKTADGRTCYEMAYTEDWPKHAGRHLRLCGKRGAKNPQLVCFAGAKRLSDSDQRWPRACDVANVALNDHGLVWMTATGGPEPSPG